MHEKREVEILICKWQLHQRLGIIGIALGSLSAVNASDKLWTSIQVGSVLARDVDA